MGYTSLLPALPEELSALWIRLSGLYSSCCCLCMLVYLQLMLLRVRSMFPIAGHGTTNRHACHDFDFLDALLAALFWSPTSPST